jgi:hypothetical protein
MRSHYYTVRTLRSTSKRTDCDQGVQALQSTSKQIDCDQVERGQ